MCYYFASRHLFDVAQYSPAHSAKHMQQIVKDIHKKFTENRDRQGKNCFIVVFTRAWRKTKTKVITLGCGKLRLILRKGTGNQAKGSTPVGTH